VFKDRLNLTYYRPRKRAPTAFLQAPPTPKTDDATPLPLVALALAVLAALAVVVVL
jgi:hypothetical protein